MQACNFMTYSTSVMILWNNKVNLNLNLLWNLTISILCSPSEKVKISGRGKRRYSKWQRNLSWKIYSALYCKEIDWLLNF